MKKRLYIYIYMSLARYPVFFGHLIHIKHFTDAYRRLSKKIDAKVDYFAQAFAIKQQYTSAADVPTAFFLRCALETSCKTIVEIGTYEGQRIITLKSLLPDRECYGLDVLKTFENPFASCDVKFDFFSSNFFTKAFDMPLLVCNGTLCYFEESQLQEFLKSLNSKGFSLAFVEPTSANKVRYYHIEEFQIKNSIKRSGISYYHDYDRLLAESGFKMVTDISDGADRSLNLTVPEFSCRYFAVPTTFHNTTHDS